MERDRVVSTNLRIYFGIVRDSIETIDECFSRDVRPKPEGSPGSIITFDPKRESFKNAFVAIVFAGVFIEALFHVLIGLRFGTETAKRLDRRNYEDKATVLGAADPDFLSELTRFRELRKNIVHEKAHFEDGKWWVAQNEAHFAFDLIQNVQKSLGVDVESDRIIR